MSVQTHQKLGMGKSQNCQQFMLVYGTNTVFFRSRLWPGSGLRPILQKHVRGKYRQLQFRMLFDLFFDIKFPPCLRAIINILRAS